MSETMDSDPPQVANAKLPNTITLQTFTAARIKEIHVMKKALQETTGVKMAFQKLPFHMRRRAMAHDVKRLPRRLREIHANQMKKSGLPPKSKRPSRVYRRRPYNLLNDYALRRRRVKWLNTHIWHAKRFIMVEKWGYKLPYRPCDKAFRACYRAATQHCLLQDVSYNRVIELNGNYQYLVENLAKLTDPKIGLTFGAKCYYQGKKFGKITIFDLQCENKKVLGQVEFVWRNPSSSLWLFVHPAFYGSVLNTFINLFQLKLSNTDQEVDSDITVYNGIMGVTLKELQFELGRIKLTGPLSTSVLKSALKIADTDDTGNLPPWCQNCDIATLSEQNKLFKNLTNVNVLPPNLVLSVLVHDPRIILPKKRTKIALELGEIGDIEPYQNNLSSSPLWDGEVRQYVKNNQPSNAVLNKMRTELLVPGTELNVAGEILPVILFWQNGSRTGCNSSWDVILPSAWIQHFFLAFYMFGGRAGGLRETESMVFEESQFDILPPDTLAGQTEELKHSEECKETFFKLPPNKRTNYSKFGIVSPFSFHWPLLLKEWGVAEDKEEFFVLRDKSLLKNIKDFISKKNVSITLLQLPENCLVPVQILPVKKGQCKEFAIICIPSEADLKKEPEEAKHKDCFMKKRNALRRSHKLMLKRLIKRRKRAKKAGKPVIKTDAVLLETYKTEMRKLWLPEPTAIRNSCCRTVMGFVKQGSFCYSLGRSKGIGYIVAASLKNLAALSCRNKVLFRNTNTRQYRVAELDVIV